MARFRLNYLGGALPFRRKKTLADRVQDYAADVVEVVDRAASTAREAATATLASVAPALPRAAALPRPAQVADVVAPVFSMSSRVAGEALSKSADTAASGLAAAKDASAAAGAAVASTGAAAAGAVGGALAAVGGVLATVFSVLWWLVRFLTKAAILAGVAYAGWQWLQSRQQDASWDAAGYTPPTATGSSYSAPSGSASSPAPAVP